jgi:multimeric flavodoxin WrbA
MNQLATDHHSARGHVEPIAREADRLLPYDGIIRGSPTCPGGICAPFIASMDPNGRLCRRQGPKGKLAAGFTVSSLPAGDEQSTLGSMFVVSMQHGMAWVGNPCLPEQHTGVSCDNAGNRLGSWSRRMAQAGHASPADAFVPGDLKTARTIGWHFADTRQRITTPA